MQEIENAILKGTRENVAEECADVANFAMMIADNATRPDEINEPEQCIPVSKVKSMLDESMKEYFRKLHADNTNPMENPATMFLAKLDAYKP